MPTIEVDGKKLEVKDGDNLLEACLDYKLELPYFCWHPAMGSVGSCRQCAVRVYANEEDTRGRILMACMTPVQDGMRLSVNEPTVSEFRDKCIEVTMANHPHDCPVCEEGGECHLQDMTIMSHHTSRRFRGTKKTYNNQYLGPCIGHEMNRCIACYRCLRFYRDYAGGRDLTVLASRENVYFGRYEEGCLESVFSGNLAEVCPTGVFTDKTLARSYNRKWDLQSAPSICDGCSLGCNTAPSERYGKIKRIVNRYHGDINGYFICDLGRFGYDFNNHPERFKQAFKRNESSGELSSINYSDAIQSVQDLLSGENSANDNVIGIGSDRASVEENFALQQLVGAENFCSGLNERSHKLLQTVVDVYRDPAIHCPTLKEIEACDAVLVLGEDLLNTAARMALSVRQATRNLSFELAKQSQIPVWQDEAVRTLAQDERSPLMIATPYATGLDEIASHCFNGDPQQLVQLANAVIALIEGSSGVLDGLDADIKNTAQTMAESLLSASNPLVISGASLQSKALVKGAAQIAKSLARRVEQSGNGSAAKGKANLCYVLPQSNSMGTALLAGQTNALNIEQILEKVAAKPGYYSLIILQNDLYHAIDKNKADQLFADSKHCVVIDQLPNATTQRADILLPARTVVETEGTLVNYEGRAQRFFEVYENDNPNLKDNWKTLVNIARAFANEGTDQNQSLTALANVKVFDDLVQLLERQGGLFGNWSAVTPDHNFRIAGMKVPRQPHRYSGRTSINADKKVAENQRPDDQDSALTFSMEGAPINVPSSLNALVWSPGWNSNEAVNKFQDEIGGHLRGGDPGVLLFEQMSEAVFNVGTKDSSAGDEPRANGKLLAVAERRLFDSHTMYSLSNALIKRAAPQCVQMNTDTAQRNQLQGGATIEITVHGGAIKLTVKINDSLPDGVITVPDAVQVKNHFPISALPDVVDKIEMVST